MSQGLTRRKPPCTWLAPNIADLLAHMWIINPPTYVFGTLPLDGGQW